LAPPGVWPMSMVSGPEVGTASLEVRLPLPEPELTAPGARTTPLEVWLRPPRLGLAPPGAQTASPQGRLPALKPGLASPAALEVRPPRSEPELVRPGARKTSPEVWQLSPRAGLATRADWTKPRQAWPAPSEIPPSHPARPDERRVRLRAA
jgi:hypothetical protein